MGPARQNYFSILQTLTDKGYINDKVFIGVWLLVHILLATAFKTLTGFQTEKEFCQHHGKANSN